MDERVFYDGHCGLCHRAVKFILAHDDDAIFRFAPLDSEAFRAAVPESTRASLPDSMVVQTSSGELLIRSDAMLYVLERLGGRWRYLSIFAKLLPTKLRDYVYDRIAGARYRMFAKPPEVCPMIPPNIRNRFDL